MRPSWNLSPVLCSGKDNARGVIIYTKGSTGQEVVRVLLLLFWTVVQSKNTVRAISNIIEILPLNVPF